MTSNPTARYATRAAQWDHRWRGTVTSRPSFGVTTGAWIRDRRMTDGSIPPPSTRSNICSRRGGVLPLKSLRQAAKIKPRKSRPTGRKSPERSTPMAPDANFAHDSQPDGTDDRGNPLWLGQNLPALLAAAQDVAIKRDRLAGTTKHLDELFLTLISFATSATRAAAKRQARHPRPILSNVPSPNTLYRCPDCARRFDRRDDHLNHAADVHGHNIPREEPIPGWHGDQDDPSGPQT